MMENFNSMTLYQFNALKSDQQAMATWDGTFAASRKNGILRVHLYALPEFYVEVFYQPSGNKIVAFRAFSCPSQLEPYLDEIDINVLLS